MIYLLRHLKVNDFKSVWMNSKEFNQWVEDYDFLELSYSNIQVPNDIKKIYVSSQNRAIKTADSLKIEYKISNLLEEVNIEAFIKTSIKFPKWFWLLCGRIMWYFNLTKKETRKQTDKRIEDFISSIDLDSNTLIISHGFFMIQLIKKLKNLGFEGNIPLKLKNGEIYSLLKGN